MVISLSRRSYRILEPQQTLKITYLPQQYHFIDEGTQRNLTGHTSGGELSRARTKGSDTKRGLFPCRDAEADPFRRGENACICREQMGLTWKLHSLGCYEFPRASAIT